MDEKVKPHYDTARRELTVAGKLIKRFRRPSKNQVGLLMAFEEEGWPEMIFDPLPGEANVDAKHRLRDTVYHLNVMVHTLGYVCR